MRSSILCRERLDRIRLNSSRKEIMLARIKHCAFVA
jgi:hypothetical protein